jgi:anti-sigma factor RsiW
MSGHEHWEDEVAAYLLGALEPGEAVALEGHLDACAECRARLRWLRPAVDLLAESVERYEPPAALRARILAEARPRRSWGGRRRLAAVAAAALLTAAVAGYAIRGGGPGGNETMVRAGTAPAMTARVVREGDSGMLRLADVHRLPSGMVLEAWVRRNGEVSPTGGLFLPDRHGQAMTTIPDLSGVEAVMVTAEPRGGSDAPTSAPMVTVSMAGA